jgi:hypothetical protein
MTLPYSNPVAAVVSVAYAIGTIAVPIGAIFKTAISLMIFAMFVVVCAVGFRRGDDRMFGRYW